MGSHDSIVPRLRHNCGVLAPIFATAVTYWSIIGQSGPTPHLILLGLVYMPLFVPGLSHLVPVGFGPSKRLLRCDFPLAMMGEKGAVGSARKARRSGTERVVIKPRG